MSRPFRLIAQPGQGLRGVLRVPGDKSISHRAVILSGLAVGESVVTGLLESDDVLRTIGAMRQFGVRIGRSDGDWRVGGQGVGGLVSPVGTVDFGNSGTGVRLCMGAIAATPLSARFSGDASLSRRPMGRVTRPLETMGAVFLRDDGDGDELPLTIHGAQWPVPIDYRLPIPSAQVKSAVLLAALNTPGQTTVIEPVATRDHTERLLQAYGACIAIGQRDGERAITVTGHRELRAQNLVIPGDPSSAAFPIVAALISPDSDVTVEGVLLNPLRSGFLATLQDMGGDIAVSDIKEQSGETVATIRARSSRLKGCHVPAARAPSMIDEYPVVAVAAAAAEGTTTLEGLAELRVKESDRLEAVAAGLAANGVEVRTGADWMTIEGGRPAGGGVIDSRLDHRIVMAFAVLGLACRQPVTVENAQTVDTSFPGFCALMQGLGASIDMREV